MDNTLRTYVHTNTFKIQLGNSNNIHMHDYQYCYSDPEFGKAAL